MTEATDQAIELRSNVLPAMFLEDYRAIRKAKRLLDEASSAYQATRKKAKANGVDLDALSLFEKLNKLEPEEAELRLKTMLKYAGFTESKLAATELFSGMTVEQIPEKAKAEWRESMVEETGYDAGRGGQNRDDNPFPTGSELAGSWDRGWCSGQASIAAEMGPKPRKARAPRRGGAGAEMGPSAE